MCEYAYNAVVVATYDKMMMIIWSAFTLTLFGPNQRTRGWQLANVKPHMGSAVDQTRARTLLLFWSTWFTVSWPVNTGAVQVKSPKQGSKPKERSDISDIIYIWVYSGPTLLSSFWYWGIFFSIWDSSFMVVWNTQIRRPNYWTNWSISGKTSCTHSMNWSGNDWLFLWFLLTYSAFLHFLVLQWVGRKATRGSPWIIQGMFLIVRGLCTFTFSFISSVFFCFFLHL